MYRSMKSGVKFVDGSWHLNKERKPLEEYQNSRLPGACFFDIDAVSDASSPLPHMLPSPEVFAQACTELGISNNDHVLIYVHNACFSAARVWWTFKVFNHHKVSIIDGGIEAWKKAGGDIESGPVASIDTGQGGYENRGMDKDLVFTSKQVLDVVSSGSAQIIDARSPARFRAEVPEPRDGVEGGHIPGSLNLPFNALVREDDVTSFRSPEEMRDAFKEVGVIFGSKVITTCGSGVTASILSLAMYILRGDLQMAPVFDGSWSEWGADKCLPKMK